MKEDWWESSVCYLCDYWWALLLGLVLAWTVYFTRTYWLPMVGLTPDDLETPAITTAPVADLTTSTSHPPTTVPATQLSMTETITPGALSGYTNTTGEYAFNYPTEWDGTEHDSSDVQFVTPEGAVVYIHTEPRPAGEQPDDFATYLQNNLPYDVLNSVETNIAGQPALCQQVTQDGEQQITALTCYLVAEGQGYALSLTGLDALTADNLQNIQARFMDLIVSFILTP